MSQLRKLILASESPRRKDLLAKAGFSFHIFSVKVSESLEKNLKVDEQILHIARQKAKASLLHFPSKSPDPLLILAADTMVVLDNEPLGKPENFEQAVEFLSRLSGNTHSVKTAVVLVEGPIFPVIDSNSMHPQNPMSYYETIDLRQMNLKFVEGIATTEVTFKLLSLKEITEYVESGEPMDKAGAYGIQGHGQNFVQKIQGSYDNVVGLSIDLVKDLLQKGSWELFK